MSKKSNSGFLAFAVVARICVYVLMIASAVISALELFGIIHLRFHDAPFARVFAMIGMISLAPTVLEGSFLRLGLFPELMQAAKERAVMDFIGFIFISLAASLALGLIQVTE